MYLKEIKIQGFKSFADRISIELDNGITGVVGPNGSGKSNVVDAVRWVLGEQSIKSLRGDSTMTDVIFSGSKSRNPLNVASVTLLFDNSDKYIPLEFNEVAIKRKVYRDGTNEYFINNEQCRLKDIVNVLLDTGISKESFNIISQGKIEEIISSRPYDRRVIFEEAAGVLKYKKRKEEALRKLERTHNNMERVNDIINEVEIQVEPLRIQKDIALDYIKNKEELENIEIALITSDITNINSKYQQSKIEIDELNQEILNVTTDNNKNEVIIEEDKKELSKLDSDIAINQKKLLELTKLVEQINSQKQIILERKKYEVEDIKLHDNLVNLKEEQLKIENTIANITNDIKLKQLGLETINNTYNELNSSINQTKEVRRKLEIELANKLREGQYTQNKIDHLKESIDNNSSLPSSVVSVLNNPKLRGIHNAFGNIIEVSELHSLAITTALGLATANIITDNEVSAKEAITYLKNNQLGRATFFPINIIKPRTVDETTLFELKKIDGFINVASELVKYDTKYRNIVYNQLGNVIVTKDLNSANLISKRLNYRYRIVTIDGELLNIGGSITGGNQQKSRNVIMDKYELENHLSKLNNIVTTIKELENKINSNDNILKSFEDKMYLSNKEKINIETIIHNFQLSLEENKELQNKINNEVQGTNNILKNTLSDEEEMILKDYYEAIKNRDEVNNILALLNKKREVISDKIEEVEHQLKKENSLYASKTKELNNLEIAINRMDVKLDNLLNILSETYSITYEAAVTKYTLEIEENVARNKVNSLKKILKEIGMVNLNAPEEYDRISERYEFLIKQRTDLTNAENTLLEIINEMDQVMEVEFLKTFKIIEENFESTFKELFKGGEATLKLTDPDNVLETGVEIIVSPPGKKLTSISLLSGGEKTFTAISLLFAILKSRPVPYCILDEVEASLDEVNVESFGSYLLKLKEKTQFILITHKKKTMEFTDVLYGITMQESGVSKLVSVKLQENKR
ncbi:MAG: AAA family ATPase [Bacilli bacterium]|nr:AAA family ATPase [Bacilli bacterium]MDD4282742.1 AAA family ATPase [Bacilli bacterium]MDD4718873.1 AAA family ATPase [Bacilli bacterium]